MARNDRPFMPPSWTRDTMPKLQAVPLIGQREQEPAFPRGRYSFHVAVIVKRDGRFEDIDAFRVHYAAPQLSWEAIENACVQYTEILRVKEPERIAPQVKPLWWQFLEFTPQVLIDKVATFEAAKAAALNAEVAVAAGDGDEAEAKRLRAIVDELAAELGLERAADAPMATEGGEGA